MAVVDTPPTMRPPGPRRRAGLGTRRQRIVALLVILGALGFLVFRGLTNATEYFKTTTEAVQQRARLGTHVGRRQAVTARTLSGRPTNVTPMSGSRWSWIWR